LLFLLAGVVLCVGFLGGTDYLINRKENFQLNPQHSNLILGHSHSECSMNDALIQHTLNLSQSGEAYFYSFVKIRKLLETNPGIKHVYVEFTNNCIITEMNDWLYADKYMVYRYPKYSAMMTLEDKFQLAKHNPTSFFKAQPMSVKTKLKYLFSGSQEFVKTVNWGGYISLDRIFTTADSIRKVKNFGPQQTIEISEDNLIYLRKIVDVCHDRGVAISFIRSPQHHAYPLLKNEPLLSSILKSRFPEVPYLDFNTFPIPTDGFADLEHLNKNGSTRFSLAMDTVMNGK
jgi:hypothetical protein